MDVTLIDRIVSRALRRALGAMKGGRLTVVDAVGRETFGDAVGRETFGDASEVDATVIVKHPRFYRRIAGGGDIGAAESYMDGDWTSPDLVALARLAIRNGRVLESGGVVGAVRRAISSAARRLRDNTVAGSRRHIRRHYDLGNDFFRLFLDRHHVMYSCGRYETPSETLERAQRNKLNRICRLLDLRPGERVLEIGTGWGGFAAYAAAECGCRVTTTTISDAQYRYARQWAQRLGEAGRRIDVRLEDYRTLTGTFDKIVSIEMFEAVGLRHYDEYFAAIERLLAPEGAMLLQTITVDEQWFPRYHGAADWIEKYIFPGGELASVGEILKSLARVTNLSLYHAENLGTHYARTLRAWRERFHANLDAVRALGFDERFVRMWDLYLASCEAAFLERHTGVFQILLNRNGSQGTMFNEPWWSEDVGSHREVRRIEPIDSGEAVA